MAESEKVCPQTDVWALGLIAHRLLTGKEHWTAQTLTHLVAQNRVRAHRAAERARRTLGAAYDAWFGRCCARAIAGRFKTAGEAISALAVALRVTDSASPITSVPLPVSVRVPASVSLATERDMLAETSAADAITTPHGTRPSHLGGTQFGAAGAKPSRVSKTLGYVVGGVLVCFAGGLAAWKMTAIPEAGGAGPAGSISAVATGEAKPPGTLKTAEPVATIMPV